MKISGFTIIRNAINYDFPVVESIKSVLPIVDEFVIALGNSDDKTDELISSIKSDKIKIIHTQWDSCRYNIKGMIYANQTDIALQACTGDWFIYLQADEVLHEDALPIIREACNKYIDDKNVDGFLLRYIHLYGDYEHYIDARHFGYPKEIRIVRRQPDIHSWRDAQSFRIIPNFNYKDYGQTEGTQKLRCILLKNAYIFHYGWCRDPRKMGGKQAEQILLSDGVSAQKVALYNYGNISAFPMFHGKHPAVMQERIASCPYRQYLQYEGKAPDIRKIFGTKYRVLKAIERFLPNGGRIGGFKNYRQIGTF